MEHPFDKEFQVCSNEVPGFTNGDALRRCTFMEVFIAKTFKTLLLMNHWPNIMSIVVLDTQALLTIGTHIVKKHCIHYDAGERLRTWACC